MKERVYNFSAGPGVLPEEVLSTAASEMLNYHGTGMSVAEMSHRSKMYLDIFEETKADLRRVMAIPDNYEIVFMQGGATFQFSAVPQNLMGENGSADYVITGSFAETAAKEAKKYGHVNIAYTTEARNHTYIPAQADLRLTEAGRYFYYCSNNTIYGTEWKYIPEAAVPVVCDMSSNILSEPVEVSKFGLIFAGVQKNMAPAGGAVVIIDKKLAGNEFPHTPKIMSYKTAIEKDSMDNTPPCYMIYMLGLNLKWVIKQGGLPAMSELKKARSKLIYDFLDESKLFIPVAEPEARSGMNITFRTDSAERDKAFVSAAEKAGCVNLAGHRLVGGIRASIYNAMPIEGVEKLVAFMKEYEGKSNV